MYNKLYFCFIMFFFLGATVIPKQSNAGGVIDDIKHFVTQNHHYNHALTVGVGIWTYWFLNNLIKSKRFHADPSAAMVLAFIGAYVTSRIAKDYPGYTTIAALATSILSYAGVINPRL